MAERLPSASLIDFVSNIPLFESLTRSDIETVAGYMDRRQLRAGEILFNQWDKADAVYFIEKGALDVLRKSGPDEYSDITTLRRGRSVGEMSIIDNFPRAATVRASTNTRVVVFSRAKFEQLMREHHQMGIEILKGLARFMAQNLRKTSSRLADYMLPLG